MGNDARQLSRVLTRREVLALVGATGIVVLTRSVSASERLLRHLPAASARKAGAALTGVCVVRPEQTEGPYFVDELLNRSDIRLDPSDGSVKPGAQLQLDFNVTQMATGVCTPLAGLYVDIWHTDALGVYSDVQDRSFDTRGKRFLRGYQVTDASGRASFTTIYPGWYQGRTVHIHLKIRTAPNLVRGYEFTSQLYFDDTLTDTVHGQQPYASKGQRTLRNSGDGIYSQGGSELLLAVVPAATGYAAAFDIALENVTAIQSRTWTGVKDKYQR